MDNLGSSPLTRGIRHVSFLEAAVNGIIPARAGNTTGRLTTRSIIRDHPRSRGEYELTKHLYLADEGSSPLARGILKHHK